MGKLRPQPRQVCFWQPPGHVFFLRGPEKKLVSLWFPVNQPQKETGWGTKKLAGTPLEFPAQNQQAKVKWTAGKGGTTKRKHFQGEKMKSCRRLGNLRPFRLPSFDFRSDTRSRKQKSTQIHVFRTWDTWTDFRLRNHLEIRPPCCPAFESKHSSFSFSGFFSSSRRGSNEANQHRQGHCPQVLHQLLGQLQRRLHLRFLAGDCFFTSNRLRRWKAFIRKMTLAWTKILPLGWENIAINQLE